MYQVLVVVSKWIVLEQECRNELWSYTNNNNSNDDNDNKDDIIIIIIIMI